MGVAAATVAALLLALVPATAGAATLTVDTTVDEDAGAAGCALREAITAANLDGNYGGCVGSGTYGDDTIIVPADDYVLALGNLSINDPGNTLTIDGAGSGSGGTSVDGDDATRVFHVVGGGATLKELEITGGLEATQNGGGILTNAGTSLTLDAAAVFENQAGFDGGGVLAAGSLAVTNGTTITNNVGGSAAGAVSQMGGGIGYRGSSAADSLSVSDSTISGNTIRGLSATGGGLAAFPGTAGQELAIDDSDVSDNGFGGTILGGGIAFADFDGRTTLTVSDTRVFSNETFLNNSSITRGAGIWVQTGNLELIRSEVSANTATQVGTGTAQGAGLWLSDDAEITDSVISANDVVATAGVGAGGGIHVEAGGLTTRRSTVGGNSVAGNFQAWGGGINYASASPGVLTMINSTVSGNGVEDAGSDPPNTGEGGGIRLGDGTGELLQTTIAANSAETVGDALRVPGSDVLTVRASVLDGAEAADVCSGDVDSAGDNVARGTSCALAGTGDVENVDPQLATLGDNGGPDVGAPGAEVPLETHALAAASAAVDRVAVADCLDEGSAPLTEDERGFPRPYPVDCDSGAYERIVCGTALADGSAIFGTSAGEPIAGTGGADIIFGLGGSDQITAAGGGDVVCGGDDNDFLEGGLGQDALIGDGGQDRASYADRGASEPVTARIGTTTGNGNADDGAGDNLANGIEILIGGLGDDTLAGDGAANELAGGGGSDTADYSIGGAVQINLGNGEVTGAQGADSLTSMENATGSPVDDLLVTGMGDNHFDGGGGADTASFAVIPLGVNASLATGVVTGQATTQDTLANVENLRGSAAADVLTGNGAANVLEGLGGNDSLTGAGAADILRLGAGDDSAAAQDGLTDTIDCAGGGADKATVDTSPPETYVACPNSDGDALLDLLDACPTQAATTANGCPAAAPPAKKKCKKGRKLKKGKCVKKKSKKKKKQ